MKKSELIARLSGIEHDLSYHCGTKECASHHLDDEDAVLIARALDVPVEPDEVELPERFDGLVRTSSKDGSYSIATDFQDTISVTFSSAHGFDFNRKLADAFFVAYNSRQTWPTGDPPHGGFYFVKFRDGGAGVQGWSIDGGWGALGGHVTGWMPIPA